MSSTQRKPQGETRAHQGAGVTTEGANEVSIALNALVADLFVLYLKTKHFHWHMTAPHFRDYHLLLDEQGSQVLAKVDLAAERVRKLGRSTLRSVRHVARLQRVADSDAEVLTPDQMLTELHGDNVRLASALRETHELYDRHNDFATASAVTPNIHPVEARVLG